MDFTERLVRELQKKAAVANRRIANHQDFGLKNNGEL
jgi:hypothetical protein